MIKKYSILLTFFCLWLTSYIAVNLQYYIAFGLIMTLGILHGSNDISLLGKLKNTSSTSKMFYFLVTYVAVVFFAGICFYFFPTLALICFVLFSGYHFGEQHFHDSFLIKWKLNKFFYTIYGLLVLFLLFILNLAETQEIVTTITGYDIPKLIFKYALVLLSLSLTALLIYAQRSHKLSVISIIHEIVLVAVFAIIFQVSNLIWSFTIYFIFWHSIPSMVEQIKFLYGETTWKSFGRYLKNSLITWLISATAMMLLLYVVKENERVFLPLLFSFLGAITFAHAFIISKIFKP